MIDGMVNSKLTERENSAACSGYQGRARHVFAELRQPTLNLHFLQERAALVL